MGVRGERARLDRIWGRGRRGPCPWLHNGERWPGLTRSLDRDTGGRGPAGSDAEMLQRGPQRWPSQEGSSPWR